MKTKKNVSNIPAEYFQELKNFKFSKQLKNISSVLLTGGAGHLGSNLLYQLLQETKYKVYLLVRADSDQHAYERINNKFKYYFDSSLENFQDRIVVFAANLEKENLGLNDFQYTKLLTNIDSVIHSAALVKHYGDYATFYQSNVQSTINLLEFTKLTKLKDFHYISTLGVFIDGYVPNGGHYFFTENSDNQMLFNKTNFYVQTKYEGELLTMKYRTYGINSNIYRVGNLSMNSKNYKNQENIVENAFFTKINTFLKLGMIPKELAEVEISPVDYTALAIVKLFNKVELSNQTYHLFNPYPANLIKLLSKNKNVNIKIATFNQFIDAILLYLSQHDNSEQIELFMLHQLWLQDINLEHLTTIDILQDKTSYILSQLNFSWPYITTDMLSNITNAFLKDGQRG